MSAPSEPGRQGESLVEQLVSDLSAAIATGVLTPGGKLPSIRALARQRSMSVFTTAEALSRLVAAGQIESRPGSGYFVVAQGAASGSVALTEPFVDSIWRLRADHTQTVEVDAGCGWLRPDWSDAPSIGRALKGVARQPSTEWIGYGNALGVLELRAQLCRLLFTRGIEALADQVLLTEGTQQALDIVIRTFLKPGQRALVERPCYPGLLALLRLQNVTPVFVPRTAMGPDVDLLDKAAADSRASIFFTNSTLHNPTGSTTTPVVAHAVLQIASRHNLIVVEDDLFWELHPRAPAPIASLDGLRSVLYVSSISKTIVPALRVGYIAGDRGLIDALARTKVVLSVGSSAVTEKIVLDILRGSDYRRHITRLRDLLLQAHGRMVPSLKKAGFTLFCEPNAGLFLWAVPPPHRTTRALMAEAAARHILLAPAHLFGEETQGAMGFRFNVSYADDARVHEWLRALSDVKHDANTARIRTQTESTHSGGSIVCAEGD